MESGFSPNSMTYSVMINGLCKMQMLSVARGLFCKMKDSGIRPTVIDYNALMTSLCREDSLEQARSLFQEILEFG